MFNQYVGRVESTDRANLVRMFYNDQTATPVYDHSPNLRSGAVTGATLAAISQKAGMNAPSFDGVNDVITLATSLSTDYPDITKGTAIVWMRVPNWLTHSTTQVAFGMQDGGARKVELIMSSANDALAAAWEGTSYQKIELTGMNALVGINNWFCVAMTWDTAITTVSIRINGGAKSTNATTPGTFTGAFSTGGIGDRTTTPAFPFNGNIGIVAIWNKVLSDANVLNLSSIGAN